MKVYIYIYIFLITKLLGIELDFNVLYSNSDENSFINLINEVYLESEISVGSNKQKFNVELDLSSYCMTIPGTEVDVPDIQKFDKSSSESFKQIETLDNIFLEKFYNGVLGEDKVILGKNLTSYDLKFVVASEYSYSVKNSYAYLGLSLITRQVNLVGLNILEQLKENNEINKQIWYLNFNENSKGTFIIGQFPHQVNKTRYNEINMRSTYFDKEHSDAYKIKFDEIYYGNSNELDKREIMEDHNSAIFSISTNLIYSTYVYGDFIYKKFFMKKIEDKICFEGKLQENSEYIYFYCQKDKLNFSEMENLNFLIRNTNMTFTLEPKDLFYMHNDYLYYLIVFKHLNIDDTDKDTEWVLGLQFLRKYTMTFDRNERIFYYYTSVSDDKEGENDNKDNTNNNDGKNKSGNNSVKYIIIIVLLSIVFIGCIVFLIFYILKIKPRKKKANELDENYEYSSKNNNVEEQNQNQNENETPFMIN